MTAAATRADFAIHLKIGLLIRLVHGPSTRQPDTLDLISIRGSRGPVSMQRINRDINDRGYCELWETKVHGFGSVSYTVGTKCRSTHIATWRSQSGADRPACQLRDCGWPERSAQASCRSNVGAGPFLSSPYPSRVPLH
jgi:hypothetical protein